MGKSSFKIIIALNLSSSTTGIAIKTLYIPTSIKNWLPIRILLFAPP